MTKAYRSIVTRYENCLAQHGDNHLGVGWTKKEDVATRYRVMLELILPTRPRVSLLDFGCGAGHLYAYIQSQHLANIVYAGADVSPRFINLCTSKYPQLSFYCLDVLQDDTTLPEFDYIVMNGVFTEKQNLSYEEMWDYFIAMLERVFRHARYGMAFNVMSKQVDWERDDLFHVPFDPLASFMKQRLSRHFQFRQDYGLYEYTTYVYR